MTMGYNSRKCLPGEGRQRKESLHETETGLESGLGFRYRAAAVWAVCLMAVLLLCGPGSAGVMTSYGFPGKSSPAGEAGSPRVFDEAELIPDSKTEEVIQAIDLVREKTGMDVVVVTAFYDGRRSARDFADDFYDQGDFGTGKKKSGVLFLIYMDGPGERGGESWISTAGGMIRILTDKRIDTILDHTADFLKNRNYSGAVQTFAADIEYYVDRGIQSGQYNFDTETGEISVYRSIRWYEAVLAALIPAIVAGSTCASIKGRYSMKTSDGDHSNGLLAYRSQCRFSFSLSDDMMVKKSVTSAAIPRTASNSSGGSGRSSSGRSSTHSSGSGGSHGGGGRRF